MTRSLALAVASVLVLLAGCAVNPYSKFYTNRLGGKSVHEIPLLIAHEGDPEIRSTSDHERDLRALMENGYVVIGYAFFNSTAVKFYQVVRQAKKVGAAVVLVQREYTNTLTGISTLTLQNPPQTITSHHSGTVHGSGSSGSYSGTSTTIVPGGSTTYQKPYSINRYDYVASFWVKAKPLPLGVWVRDLSDELRREIGSNRGVVVDIVVKGSPAFQADIMRGDIITRINDEIISDRQSYSGILGRYAGKEIVLQTYREGQERQVELRLGSYAVGEE